MSLNWALEIRSVPSSINVILFPFPVVIWRPSFVHVTSLIIALRNFALQANNRLPPGITSASLGSLIVYEQISWLSSDAAWPYDFGLPEKKIQFPVSKSVSAYKRNWPRKIVHQPSTKWGPSPEKLLEFNGRPGSIW